MRPKGSRSARQEVSDSLDLDAAWEAELPTEHRWDYLDSFPGDGQIVVIEPHTARDSVISVVIARRSRRAPTFARTCGMDTESLAGAG